MSVVTGIYCIRRKSTDECYVGQAVDMQQRWHLHRSMLNRGKHHSKRLQRCWAKYGANSFEFQILQAGMCPTDAPALMAAEQAWIDRLKPCYNTCAAGISRIGIPHTAEARQKISAAQRGRPKSPESIAKMAAFQKTRERGPLSPEHRAKLTFAGRTHSPESIRKFSASKTGKPLSEKHKAAISRTKMGRIGHKHTEESRARIAVSQRRRHAERAAMKAWME